MGADTVFAIPGENSQCQVRDDAGAWLEIDGAGDVTFSPSAAPVTEVANYRGTYAHTGKERPPSASIPITTFMPHNPVWGVLAEDKVRDFRILWGRPDIRYTKKSTPALTGAIATTGVVTFAGGDSADVIASFSTGDYGQNMVLVIDAKNYIVVNVSSAGVVTAVDAATGKHPTTAVTEDDVDFIVVPAAQYDFSASITTFVGISNPTDGVANTTLEIKLSNPLPAAKIVTAEGTLYL